MTAPRPPSAMRALLERELAERAKARLSVPAETPVTAATGLEGLVRDIAAAALGLDPAQLDMAENLASYGVDSIAITEVMVRLSRRFGISVAPTTFFEARNINHLARILRERHGAAIDAHLTAAAPPAASPAAPAVTPARTRDVGSWLRRHGVSAARRSEPARVPASEGPMPIAVIGMDGIFPRSADLEVLASHLRAGTDCIDEVPADRWDWRAVQGDPRKGPFTQVKHGGFAPGHDLFDAGFFGISPREAELIDPQHRLFMQCVWRLLEGAGHAPSSLAGCKVGLFVGINLLDYVDLANRAGIGEAQRLTGLGHAFCPNRLSFLLDIHGPSQVIDTACSSSLVAIHRAVMSIRHEGCEMAIAGGSNLMLSPMQHILFSQVGMLAPDGRCKTFGAAADGYARADGVGAVLLKPLAAAERDGDNILGVILASAEHHGGGAPSLTAPNPQSQARLIVEAHRQADIDPRTITMMECHGTGTKLGDPVEVEGLKAAFQQLYATRGLPPPAAPHCGLGSIKSNIGHAETAAGVAGLIKILLALREGQQYRSLHCETPNPLIDLAGSPFHLLHQAQPWTRPVIDGVEQPRRAGLSSFGAGGANVHMVVAEYLPPARATAPAVPQLIPLSARSATALDRVVDALLPVVAQVDFADLAFTLQVGRDMHRVRAAIVARDAADLTRQLRAWQAGDRAAIAHGEVARGTVPEAVAAIGDLSDLARKFVAGARIDWQPLHQGRSPRRVPLPTYPFELKRYWLPLPVAPTLPAVQVDGPDRVRVTLSATAFFLADHRVQGRPVLPGVMYLELARQAARALDLGPVALRNVVWLQPLAVTDSATLAVTVVAEARGGHRITIASGDVLHAQMQAVPATPLDGQVDLAALRAAHGVHHDVPTLYALFARRGLAYGPGHRTLGDLWTDRAEKPASVLAHLRVARADGFDLHPGLLDGALQAAIGLALEAEGVAALPFALAALDGGGPCPPSLWVQVRRAAAPGQLDLDLFDDDGTRRFALRGFATRAPGAIANADVLAFAPSWQAAPAATPVAFAARHVLVDAALSGVTGAEVFASADPVACLAQALAALQARVPVPAGQQVLVQVAVPTAAQAGAFAALLRTAHLEHPGLWGQVVIASPAEIERALTAAATVPQHALCRWQDGTLQVEAWAETALPPSASLWRMDGVYLVTGGGGALGRAVARHIRASAPGARVILAGRTPVADEADAMVCDVADAAAVSAMVAAIHARHGRLDAVIHAAGLRQDEPLRLKSADTFARILAPKVAGAAHLASVLDDDVRLVLFGSLSGVFGNAGQADYAAANAALADLALRRRNTLCIAWPLWRDGGMAMDADTQRLMARTTGLVPLETAAGLAALDRAMAAGAPVFAIAPGDAARLRRHFAAPVAPPVVALPATPAADDGALRRRLLAELTAIAATQLKVAVDDLDPEVELSEYGFDSIGFTQFANALNDRLVLAIAPTLFFDQPTLARLAAHLAAQDSAALADRLGVVTAPMAKAPALAPMPIPAAPPMTAAADDLIAIVGAAGILPDAPDLDAFWRNLEAGRDSIREIPADRWDWRAYWGDPQREPGRTNVKWGGFIDGVGEFDAAFFGLSPAEARAIDPQQRLLLTLAWRTLEDAGIAPHTLSGRRIGVFVGIADTGYGRLSAASGAAPEGHAMTGLAPSLGPNRISYVLNLNGPSVAVETACSSALVALHRAAEAIRNGECEGAFAGGVNTLLLPDSYIGFSRAGMLSPDGRSKPFSAAANGYARGEGAGLVYLKPLSQAERDGDRILAVIRASGENHGGRAASLTAPNPRAQADLIRAVHTRAAIDPRTITYIEAHGTGTPLGDPIEVEGLQAAFADLCRDAEARFGPASPMACGIGSVKSNVGHLELAAGMAGLFKVLLQMRHGRLAATLHCDQLNPHLKLADGPFQVVRAAASWPRRTDASGREIPRRAGISSFGFGGANAHVVLEEHVAPPPPAAPAAAGPQPILLSARSEAQLRDLARDLAQALATAPPALPDLSYTLRVAREPMDHRLAFMADSMATARRLLAAFAAGQSGGALHSGRARVGRTLAAALDGDEAVRAALAGLAGRGQGDALLQLWVNGLAADFAAFGTGRRITLPGYPFDRTVHWVNANTVAAPVPLSIAASGPVPMAAPVPDAPVEAPVPLLDRLVQLAAATLEVASDVLDPDAELGEFGFDSITMTGFATRVNDALGINLSPADFFEFATLNRLAHHISDLVPAAPRPADAPAPAPMPVVTSASDDPIAIVGLSCHFPMARDADAFWRNLTAGRDCITRIPADRWDWRAIDGDPRTDATKTNIHWGGFIDGVFEFDPLFFGISPREAKLMDPQQRLMLLHAWKAIEDAGDDPRALAGRRGGVFVGTSSSGYRAVIGDDTGGEGHVATGAVPSVGPNRISFLLDWHGPSEPVETACSSSLVALHRACEAMRNGDCDIALVGGVNTIVTPEAHINFAKAGMLSPDGRCRTFARDANGYVRGEGVAMILLKRLSEAQRDGNPVLALVRGTAINHGGRANSLTAPNTAAQAALLRTAWQRAGIDPRTLTYIEAHGTGTPLGDPVEINALKSAWREATVGPGSVADPACAIGAVKTNIGHLELAAGMAGLAKVLLQMRAGVLAPSLHNADRNPHIDLSGTPFRLLDAAQPWTRVADTAGRPVPRRAGISSFGFGGVNAHAVLEEHDVPPVAAAAPAGPVAILLSATDEARLRDQARNLLAWLDAHAPGEGDLAALAFTLQSGRTALRQRLAFAAASIAEVAGTLRAWLHGDDAVVLAGRADGRPGPAYQGPPALPAMMRHWIGGGVVDWASGVLVAPRRLRLPTYPFARDVHHVDRAYGVAADGAVLHLTAARDGLGDHRFRGACVVPGAYTLEVLRGAAALKLPLRLSGIVWPQPLLPGPAGVDVRVVTAPRPDGSIDLRLRSAQGEHARALAAPLAEAPPAALALAALRVRCDQPVSTGALYDRYAALGLDYGPAFRPLAEVWRGTDQVLARLQRPASAASADAVLHPSLVDGAFQSCLALFDDAAGGGAALPFGLNSVAVFAATPAELWVHLRVAQRGPRQWRFDLDLAAADGTIVAALRGFTVRLVAATPSVGPAPDLRAAALRHFTALLARETSLDESAIEPTQPLEAYGIDSLLITRLTEQLEKSFGPLPPTLFFDHRTLAALADHFVAHHGPALATLVGASAPAGLAPTITEQPVLRATPAAADAPIAIIGLAGRFPGARNLDAFWANLAAGRDSVTSVPATRWHAPDQRGGFIDGHDRFDPLFFNIAPREAGYMDPQERLFLQCAWEALEDAGHTRASLAPLAAPLGGADLGVFVGVMYEEYQLHGAERAAAGQPVALGGSAASIANRVSYVLDAHGPSIAVDTMCSSSLTAIHLACDALRAGSCAVALAGGVNLNLHPNKFLLLSQGRFLSSQGRCAAFGAGGDGYVPAEGVGAVLLKPLDRALADGDRIHAIIRGSALNHGGKTNGYTVPNPAAQAAVIGQALRRAHVAARDISYVEAHGTGTSLGDPIEVAALTRVFAAEGAAPGTCAIGSVKSNIGHAESAAGMAGLAKIVLQMRHGMLAPSLHVDPPNPGIDFAATPFTVQRRAAPWTVPGARIAALSSFGAGGSNAHLVVQEPPIVPSAAVPVTRDVFPLSARDPARLMAVTGRLRVALDALADDDLPHIAFTLQQGREGFEERLAVVAGSRAELVAALDRVLAGHDLSPAVVRGRAPSLAPRAPERIMPAAAAAAAWVAGRAIDWAGRRAPGSAPRRIALPAYPFAEDRYWVPGGAGPAAEITAASARVEPAAAPLPFLLAPDWRPAARRMGNPPDRVLTLLCGWAAETAHATAAVLDGDVRVVTAGGSAAERFAEQTAQVMAAVQDLLRARPAAPLVQVVVPLAGDNALSEGLAGLLRSAMHERPGLVAQCIAVSGAPTDLAALIRAERGGADTDIRIVEGQRLVRVWREVAAAPDAPSPWRDGGVHLITGGAGALGRLLCADIAAHARRPVIWLTGRSSLSPDIRRQLDAVPADIIYRQTDMEDATAVRALVDAIHARHGGIDVVIHAAGVTRDKLLMRKSAADLAAVLAPKVAGLSHLLAAFADHPPGLLLLFGSAAGALGNAGQADYAAANAWLDAMAHHLAAPRTITIDWPWWRDGGMTMPEAAQRAMAASGVYPLETAPAFAALRAILASTERQVLVLAGDHARLRAQLVAPTPPPAASPVAVAPVNDDALVPWLAAHFAAVLAVPADRFDPATPLDRYGLDSITALQVVEALERTLGPLPPSLLLEQPSLAALAAALRHSHGAALAAVTGARQSDAIVPDAPAPVTPSLVPTRWSSPLTLNQRGFHAQQVLDPAAIYYNVPIAFRVASADPARLDWAARALFAAHPILAARVVDMDDAPHLVARDIDVAVQVVATDDEPMAAARSVARRPLDPAQAVCRIFWFARPGAADGVLLLLAHHVAVDGLSSLLLGRAFWSAYAHGDARPAADFRDHALAEPAHLAQPALAARRDWWRSRLAGMAPVMPLPVEGDGASQPHHVVRAVPADRVARWRAAATRLGVSMAVFCLGAFDIVLQRAAGAGEIVLGVPTLGRAGRHFAGTIGCFVNLVTLRLPVDPARTAADRLVDLRGALAAAMDHADVPYALVARDLAERAAGRVLHDITFAYQNFTTGQDDSPLPPGVTLADDLRQAADTALALEVYEVGAALSLVAAHDAGRHAPAGIAALLDRFVTVADALAQNASRPVAALPLMDGAEQRRVVAWSRGTALKPKRAGILDRIAKQATRRPDAIAVQGVDGQLTYRQMWRRAARLANHLRAQGVRTGDVVAVLLPRGPDGIVALLAVLAARAVYLPLDPTQPPARLAALVADARPAALLADAALAAPLGSGLPLVDPVRDAAAIRAASARLRHLPGRDDDAYLIYTSGTTGTPKGVLVGHGALADHARVIAAAYDLRPRDRVLNFAAPAVDPALEQILPTLARGARVVLRDAQPWSPAALYRALHDLAVTVADLPPAYLRAALLDWRDAGLTAPLAALRLLVVGGEAPAPDLAALWRDSAVARARLVNAYGPTEATITCLLHDVAAEARGPVPLGRPLPGTQAWILDAQGVPVPPGLVGELHVGGTRLAQGYRGDEGLTAQRFITVPPFAKGAVTRLYRTGDRASFAPDGSGVIRFHGRADTQLKLRGHRIEADEVAAILRAAGARDVAVVPRDDVLVAYVATGGAPLDAAPLARAAALHLPAPFCPAAYVAVDALPLNAAGKLDAAALPAPPRGVTSGTVPQDAVEEQVLAAWRAVLPDAPATLGVHDDFFALGGHSLLALQLLARLERTFGPGLSGAALLAAPTVARQAALLRAPAASPFTPVSLREGSGPPLVLVHPVGGGLACYADLVRALPAGRPVLGLAAPGFDGGAPWSGDLAALAAHHVAALRAVHGDGPLHLAGWSMGGVLVQEMARQAHAAGVAVGLVALLDAWPPALLPDDGADDAALVRAFARDLLGLAEVPELRVGGGRDPFAALLLSPWLTAVQPGFDSGQLRRLFNLFRTHDRLLRAHRPQPLDVPVVALATAAAAPAIAAWRALSPAGLEAHELAGDHFTFIRTPGASAAAAILSAALARAERRRPRRRQAR